MLSHLDTSSKASPRGSSGEAEPAWSSDEAKWELAQRKPLLQTHASRGNSAEAEQEWRSDEEKWELAQNMQEMWRFNGKRDHAQKCVDAVNDVAAW